MALNQYQQIAYIHTIDIYKTQSWQLTAGKNTVSSTNSYPSTPTYSSVPCYMESRIEIATPDELGRTLENNIFTMNLISCEASVDIKSDYLILFHYAGHPDDGTFFEVVGQPTGNLFDLANAQRVLVKRSVKAAGVT